MSEVLFNIYLPCSVYFRHKYLVILHYKNKGKIRVDFINYIVLITNTSSLIDIFVRVLDSILLSLKYKFYVISIYTQVLWIVHFLQT